MLKKITRMITNNFGLKVLALLFSCGLWLAVVNIDDPVTTRSFTTTVSLENSDYLSGIGKYYEIINNSSTVTFKATGKRSYLERMSNSDFKAVADMELIEDFSRVPIEITPQRYAGTVTVSSKIYYLEVSVEDLVSKPFVIGVRTEGEVADAHALGNVEVSPSLLRVSGPASVVSQIDKAIATVNVDGMTEDLTDSVIPKVYDADGNEIDETELSFNIQNAMVSVEILDTKEVTLNFQTSGTLPDGYEYVGIEYSPQTVTIKGESSVLNTVNSITIPPEVLDLTDETGDLEKEVDVSSYLPDGVTMADSGKSKIQVLVQIEKHESRVFDMPTANITARNLGEGYDVNFQGDTVKVEIEGLSTELEALDASTLTGSIDVSGMTEGEHTVNLELNLDSKFKQAKQATVTVDITKKGTSADSDSKSEDTKSDSTKSDSAKNDASKNNTSDSTSKNDSTDTGKSDTTKVDSDTDKTGTDTGSSTDGTASADTKKTDKTEE